MNDYMTKHLGVLVGGTITGLIIDGDAASPDTMHGLRVTNGKKVYNVWIQCDPEGNGPGFLAIERG